MDRLPVRSAAGHVDTLGCDGGRDCRGPGLYDLERCVRMTQGGLFVAKLAVAVGGGW